MVGPGRHERPPFFQRVGAPKACRMSERRLRVSHSRMASARAHTECGGLAPLLFARREGSGFARQHRFRASAFQALGPNAPPSKCKIRAPARERFPLARSREEVRDIDIGYRGVMAARQHCALGRRTGAVGLRPPPAHGPHRCRRFHRARANRSGRGLYSIAFGRANFRDSRWSSDRAPGPRAMRTTRIAAQ